MCGRFSLASDSRSLEIRFSFRGVEPPVAPRYNIAPTQPVLTINREGLENRAQYMRWGLIPSWAKDQSIGSRMINARAETLSEKPSFRDAFRKRRCLVVADGFYEWQKVAGRKRPMRIVLQTGEPFAFAGLWESWRDPEGTTVRSCTIITTGPNSRIEPIHNRMPVILSRDDEARWLDPEMDDPPSLLQMLAPYPQGAMDAYEISTLVNSPANDVPDCIERLRLL